MINPSTFQVYNASAGSGKTFTLVKEYLKIILGSRDLRLYQQILAITFTNKAAAEMKDRILENLLSFSVMDTAEAGNDMLQVLIDETGLDFQVIRDRAKERLQDILKNYASFHIKTIDSFNNKLIKSFAFDLGLTSDFEVELDPDNILREAIDAVLARIGIDRELTSLLVTFSKQKTLEDKSWDISRDLYEVSKLILNENHSGELARLRNKPLQVFSALSQKLRKEQRQMENSLAEIGRSALSLIEDSGLEPGDFYRSQFPKFFMKLIQKDSKLDFDKESSLSRNIQNRVFYAKSKASGPGVVIDAISDQLIAAYAEAENLYEKYKLNELILKNLVPLAVINIVNKALEEIKTNNNIRLNAEFNQMISEYLISEPAAFIYEKLGERFRYFFIDEMQDTSVLQWQNLIPLVGNALSSEGSGLMLVGDAKQAIYRWRGGRAEQFIELSSQVNDPNSNPFPTKKISRDLGTNYRSFNEIINFNNSFFSHIANHFTDPEYRELYRSGNIQKSNSKTGGYVSIDFVEGLRNNQDRDAMYPELVHERILKLLDQYDPNEICILVRKKKEGVAIARFLTEKGLDIVSSETLLLKNNEKVNFIIELLQWLSDPSNEDAKFAVLNFLYDHLEIEGERHLFLMELLRMTQEDTFRELERYGVHFSAPRFRENALVEAVEDIIRCFDLTRKSDAFVQFFLDFVYEYSQRKSQKNMSFLSYWEEKKEKLNIASSEELRGVKIMTIHKSKGLEFPVVLFPYHLDIYDDKEPKAWYKDLEGERFDDFESILVDSSAVIKKTGDHGRWIYEEQRRENELDSFNLLYVCLTRAVEQLHIFTESKSGSGTIDSSAHLFSDYLKSQGIWEEGVLHYEFGNENRRSTRSGPGVKTRTQDDFISSSWREEHQIHIVANSDVLWDEDRAEAIGYGNLIHEIMERIYTFEDVEGVLKAYVNKGLVPENEVDSLRSLILKIVQHPELKSYFEPGHEIMNEREILTETGQTVIPDRLVIDDDQAVVIDYKTGNPQPAHLLQIENYALVLQKLNFVVPEKILVYIDQAVTVIKS